MLKVTDKSVQAFAENCPDLQFVGFMGCSVTSQGVIHLTRLQHLSSLDLRHISELNNETVMEVVRKCRNLTSLNLCLNWTINDSLHIKVPESKEGQGAPGLASPVTRHQTQNIIEHVWAVSTCLMFTNTRVSIGASVFSLSARSSEAAGFSLKASPAELKAQILGDFDVK
ncbi:F-box LRR-repeat 17 [Labeo rohita]|uniref:F-box LRR-repeat 17 n=1 Tax=Labeo rohita TaxID=84645 RepID=A0A498NEC2_LABRO|nr:F-box LRR-repeat 17 [Labeo rohita]